MVKQKIDIQKEVSKIWQEAKKNLKELGQRTMKLAQKGEEEVVRASKVGKLQLDIISINLKKENIFRLVGRKVYEKHTKKGSTKSAQLTSLFKQLENLTQQTKSKKIKISKLNKS